MGGVDPAALAVGESQSEIPPFIFLMPNQAASLGHCVVGSLTGVVASESVSEAFKGTLSTVGNRAWSAIA